MTEPFNYDELIEDARIALKEFREANGMTQKEFGDLLKWTQGEVSFLETRRTVWSLKKIIEVCNVFSVHPLIFLPKLRDIFFDMEPEEIRKLFNMGTDYLKKKIGSQEDERLKGEDGEDP